MVNVQHNSTNTTQLTNLKINLNNDQPTELYFHIYMKDDQINVRLLPKPSSAK